MSAKHDWEEVGESGPEFIYFKEHMTSGRVKHIRCRACGLEHQYRVGWGISFVPPCKESPDYCKHCGR